VSVSNRLQGGNCNFEHAREHLRLIFIQISTKFYRFSFFIKRENRKFVNAF